MEDSKAKKTPEESSWIPLVNFGPLPEQLDDDAQALNIPVFPNKAERGNGNVKTPLLSVSVVPPELNAPHNSPVLPRHVSITRNLKIFQPVQCKTGIPPREQKPKYALPVAVLCIPGSAEDIRHSKEGVFRGVMMGDYDVRAFCNAVQNSNPQNQNYKSFVLAEFGAGKEVQLRDPRWPAGCTDSLSLILARDLNFVFLFAESYMSAGLVSNLKWARDLLPEAQLHTISYHNSTVELNPIFDDSKLSEQALSTLETLDAVCVDDASRRKLASKLLKAVNYFIVTPVAERENAEQKKCTIM